MRPATLKSDPLAHAQHNAEYLVSYSLPLPVTAHASLRKENIFSTPAILAHCHREVFENILVAAGCYRV